MKILHITPSYKPSYIYGGPIVSVSQLCENQVLCGYDVVVYTTTANGAVELIVDPRCMHDLDGVKVYYFERITGDHTHISPKLWMAFWKNVKKFDAVHVHSWWNLLVLGVVFICVIRGIKPVLSTRGMLSKYTFSHSNQFMKAALHYTIGRYLLKHTFLHATSNSEYLICQRIIPGCLGFIAPNIIQLPDLKNLNPRIPNSAVFRIGTLSRLDPVKGIDLLIGALAKVPFNFIFKIAGGGNSKYELELKTLLKENKLENNVQWVGWQKGLDKFKYLQELDLLVIPSRTENFSVVAIEALAVGTPLLVSDQVGLFDMVKAYKWGWVTRLSVKEITVGLIDAYAAIEERIRIQSEAPEQILRIFNNERIVDLYIKAYRNLS